MPFRDDVSREVKLKSKRRSLRMNSRVPVTVEWNGSGPESASNSVYTCVVNSFGCLLVSPTDAELRQTLRLTNLVTQNNADAVVVWKGPRRPDGWELGIELITSEQDFWGIDL